MYAHILQYVRIRVCARTTLLKFRSGWGYVFIITLQLHPFTLFTIFVIYLVFFSRINFCIIWIMIPRSQTRTVCDFFSSFFFHLFWANSHVSNREDGPKDVYKIVRLASTSFRMISDLLGWCGVREATWYLACWYDKTTKAQHKANWNSGTNIRCWPLTSGLIRRGILTSSSTLVPYTGRYLSKLCLKIIWHL